MTEFLAEYGLFLAKTLTLIIGVLVLFAGIGSVVARRRDARDGHVEVQNLNDHLEQMREELESEVLDQETLKQQHKERKKRDKQEAKARKIHETKENAIRPNNPAALRCNACRRRR